MTTVEQGSKAREKIEQGLVLVITGLLEEAESAPESSPDLHRYLGMKLSELGIYISSARKYGVNSKNFGGLAQRYDALIEKMQELEKR